MDRRSQVAEPTMRFPRMTTRRWMVAVVVGSLPFAVVRLRAARFAQLADSHEAAERALGLSDLETYLLLSTPQGGENPPPERVKALDWWEQRLRPWREFITYHSALAGKYRSAAARPWSWVAPDPPSPPRPSKNAVLALRRWLDNLGQNSDPPKFEAEATPKTIRYAR